jgi:indolepyruvate ferredoxin oxidoreductase
LFATAERLLGHKQYANMTMVGLAYQQGRLPMRLGPLIAGMRASISASQWDDNYRAFQLGRLLAHADELPRELQAALATQPINPTRLAELVEDKAAILRRRWWGGLLAADRYLGLVEEAVEAMPRLDEATLRDLALRLYDLVQYQNDRYARRLYLDRVMEAYKRDRGEFEFAATKAVVRYLYKVIAIKDEVWVSHLLTSEEKRRRDYQRYRIDPARGDRIRYVHLNRPEIDLLSVKLRFHIKSRPWMLRVMKHLKFLRRLPGWHARERYFRDRYLQLVDRFRYHSRDSYREFVDVLRSAEDVRGFVEVRYPTMVEPLRRIEALLQNPLFRDPPSRPLESQAVQDTPASHRVGT